MKFRCIPAVFVAALTIGFATTATPARAASTHDVSITATRVFSDSNCFGNNGVPVHINIGDSVRWTNCDSTSPHTVTSDTAGQFDSGNIAASGGQYTRAFNSQGSFPYHCNIHPNTMMGEITVSAPPTTTTTAKPTTTTAKPTTTTAKPTTTTASTSTSTTQTTIDLTGALGQDTTTSSSSTSSTTEASTTDGGSSSAAVVLLLLVAIAAVGGAAYYAFRRLRETG